jgi:hypothetical protein
LPSLDIRKKETIHVGRQPYVWYWKLVGFLGQKEIFVNQFFLEGVTDQIVCGAVVLQLPGCLKERGVRAKELTFNPEELRFHYMNNYSIGEGYPIIAGLRNIQDSTGHIVVINGSSRTRLGLT